MPDTCRWIHRRTGRTSLELAASQLVVDGNDPTVVGFLLRRTAVLHAPIAGSSPCRRGFHGGLSPSRGNALKRQGGGSAGNLRSPGSPSEGLQMFRDRPESGSGLEEHTRGILKEQSRCGECGNWHEESQATNSRETSEVSIVTGKGRGMSSNGSPIGGRAGAKGLNSCSQESSYFVAVRHVAAPVQFCSRRRHLRVSYDAMALPPGVSSRFRAEDVVCSAPRERPLPIATSCNGRLLLAWICAALLLTAAAFIYLLLSFSLDSATAEAALFEAELLASPIAPDAWRTRLLQALALTLCQSFIIVDGIKALSLAFTSPPAINQVLPPNTGGAKAIRKVCSQLHKVLDVCM